MQLPEIDFSSLEIREIGAWPLILRILVIIGAVIAAIVLSYFLVFASEFSDLEDGLKKLEDKKKEFKDQYTQAVNIDAYTAQMKDMQADYEMYVKELPSSSNIPELIDSITKIGEKNGLKFNYIKIGDPKLIAGFYMTLPLTLNVTGTYHNFGLFVSDVSKLARIVTIGDFTIKPVGSTDKSPSTLGTLDMTLDAQTYWLASTVELQQQKAVDSKANKAAAPKAKAAAKPGPNPPAGAPPAPGAAGAAAPATPAGSATTPSDQPNMPIPGGKPVSRPRKAPDASGG